MPGGLSLSVSFTLAELPHDGFRPLYTALYIENKSCNTLLFYDALEWCVEERNIGNCFDAERDDASLMSSNRSGSYRESRWK